MSCQYTLYLQKVPTGDEHTHEICVPVGATRVVSSEAHGHRHEVVIENGTAHQTPEDIIATGHVHPIIAIKGEEETSKWKWLLLLAVIIGGLWVLFNKRKASKAEPEPEDVTVDIIQQLLEQASSQYTE